MKWTITGALLLLMMVSSCKKYVDINIPPDALGEEQAFADSGTATSTVLGLYGSLANGGASVAFSVIKFGAMSADEGYYLTNTSFDAFKNNTLSAGNATVEFWTIMYTRIGRANYVIEGITASTTLSPTLKNQLLGEAKCWRAWLYFIMVNYFGDVPLVTNTDALKNALLPRAPVADVYQQIVKDLTEANNHLTASYPSPERARINKYAASALLAKVYLYQGNWAGAESEASAVINSGLYSLTTDLNKVFLNNSNETIWQISLVGATSTPATIMGSEFIPASTIPSFVLYDTLANTFEANDQRKVNWTKPIVYISKTYYYPFKYKLKTATAGNEYPIMMRLADTYLVRAEARAQQNKPDEAKTDLDAIRSRAGLGNTTASTKEAILSAIEHERWVELFTEFSDRWFNLKRLTRATAVLSLIKPSWQPFQQLYPLPQQTMTSNPNLRDNTGY